VIILGIVLLILGFIFGVPILWTIGIILVVIGVVLYIAGRSGRQIGPRKNYY
jgi:hypothetical protein